MFWPSAVRTASQFRDCRSSAALHLSANGDSQAVRLAQRGIGTVCYLADRAERCEHSRIRLAAMQGQIANSLCLRENHPSR